MANLVLVKIARVQTKATCYQTVWYLLDHLRCSFSQEIDVIEVLQRSPSLKGRRIQTDVYLWRREISCRHAENCHAEEQTNLSLHGEYTEHYGDTWHGKPKTPSHSAQLLYLKTELKWCDSNILARRGVSVYGGCLTKVPKGLLQCGIK